MDTVAIDQDHCLYTCSCVRDQGVSTLNYCITSVDYSGPEMGLQGKKMHVQIFCVEVLTDSRW